MSSLEICWIWEIERFGRGGKSDSEMTRCLYIISSIGMVRIRCEWYPRGFSWCITGFSQRRSVAVDMPRRSAISCFDLRTIVKIGIKL